MRTIRHVWEYAASLCTIVLVISGLVGLTFQAVRDGGWISSTLAKAWTVELDHPLVALPLTLAGLYVFLSWRRQHVELGHASRMHNVILYGLMAAGAYYLGEFALSVR
jgi:hypothetical protein